MKDSSRTASSIRKKLSTAQTLLKQGEYERLSLAAIRFIDDKSPTWIKRTLSPLRIRTILNLELTQRPFDPLATSPRKTNPSPSATNQTRIPLAAVILDNFSFTGWNSEVNCIPVTPSNFIAELSTETPDFLLVESAWQGNSGAWAHRLSTPGVIDEDLKNLVTWCKDHSIPTIFWNKEDPVHFEDFIATAKLFDYVFTTDGDKIPDYREALGHNNVAVLPFAAQPAVHNPVRNPNGGVGAQNKRWHVGDIAFAGTYFTQKYESRRQQMDLLLEASSKIARQYKKQLTIFSRYGNADKRYRFPKKFQPYVVGSLSYDRMLTAFNEHKIFLNVNSVTESSTMCARRLFEITAAGSSVITTPSAAIRNFFSEDMLSVVSNAEEAENTIRGMLNSPMLRDRMNHRAQRHIWDNHTYGHRLQSMLEVLGKKEFQSPWSKTPQISCICPTTRPEQLPHLLQQLGAQTGVELEVILLAHGFDVSEKEISALAAEADLAVEQITVVHCPRSNSLGENLNRGVALANNDIIAKIDDDDYYLPYYLHDQAKALLYSGADLVGKQANYTYLSERNELVLRNPEKEHIYTTFLAGPTFVGRRQTFKDHPFESRTTGEDTQFLRDVFNSGKKIYSADRFNFIQVRHGAHTWDADEWHFLAHSAVKTYGLNLEHVEV